MVKSNIIRSDYHSERSVTVKFYINSELDLKQTYTICTEFLSLSEDDSNFIQLGVLNTADQLEQLLRCLASETVLMCYDYASLQLTLSEFKVCYEFLKDHHITLQFLKDCPTFISHTIKLCEIDTAILSQRVKKGLVATREKGTVIGRPAVSPQTQMEIRKLHQNRLTLREIATRCGVSLGTVCKCINKGN